MSKGDLFMAATLESKRKPNSFGEKKMQNIYTLIKKREVKAEWYKHWDGLERVVEKPRVFRMLLW